MGNLRPFFNENTSKFTLHSCTMRRGFIVAKWEFLQIDFVWRKVGKTKILYCKSLKICKASHSWRHRKTRLNLSSKLGVCSSGNWKTCSWKSSVYFLQSTAQFLRLQRSNFRLKLWITYGLKWFELCMRRLISLKTKLMMFKAFFHSKPFNRAVIIL